MPDDRELRIGLLGELRRVVGFDAHAFVLTDPVTAVGSSPLADVPRPLLGMLPRPAPAGCGGPTKRRARDDALLPADLKG